MEEHKELYPEQSDSMQVPSIAERGLASDSLENQPDTKTGYSASLPDAAPAERDVPQSSVSTVPGAPQDIVPNQPSPPDIPSTSDAPVLTGEVYTPASPAAPKKKGKGAKILLAAVLCLVLAVGAVTTIYISSYNNAQRYAAGGLYEKAQDMLTVPFITSIHDPQFLDYLDGCILMTQGDYDDAIAILAPMSGYRDCADLLNRINYAAGNAALEQGNLVKAMQYLEPLAAQNYSNSRALYHQAKLDYALERVNYLSNIESVETGLAYLDALVADGYTPARGALTNACEIIYQHAIALYNNTEIYNARSYFSLIADYSRANDYLTLCAAWYLEASVEELWAIRDFADAESMLYQDYLCEFLVGSWYTGDRSYYGIMEPSGDEYTFTYNLPWQYSGNFEIVDGVLKIFHNGSATSSNEFRFTINSWNEITVYCYKNGKSYTLYRT